MGSGFPSTTFSNRLNDVVNVAILVMLVFLGVRYVAGRASVSSMGYELGETVVGLPESVVTGGNQTLLLQVRSTCQYCSQAMPAYRRIAERIRTAHKPVRLVAIAYEPTPTCREYLRLNSVVVDDVVRPNGSEPKLGVTPAILLLDSRRKVLGSWVGVLSASQEAEVEKALGLLPVSQSGDGGPFLRRLVEEQNRVLHIVT